MMAGDTAPDRRLRKRRMRASAGQGLVGVLGCGGLLMKDEELFLRLPPEARNTSRGGELPVADFAIRAAQQADHVAQVLVIGGFRDPWIPLEGLLNFISRFV